MNSLAGAWLNKLVAQDSTRLTLSTMVAVWGNSSETQRPDWPWRWKARRVPSRLVPWLLPMNANRLPSMNDPGIGWPLSSISFGL